MVEKYTNGVWGELEGYKKCGETTFDLSSFPASFQSGGLDMSDYRIYGANDGVGDQTKNLFDKTSAIPDKQYDRNGNLTDPIESGTWYASGLIEVEPNETYVRSKAGATVGNVVNFYASDKTFQSRNIPGTGVPFLIPSTTKYISFAINANTNPIEQVMLTAGSTAPAQHIPFGYQINAVVRSENLCKNDFRQGGGYWYQDYGNRNQRCSDETLICVEPNATYTMSWTNSNLRYAVQQYSNQDKNFDTNPPINDSGWKMGNSYTFTTVSDTHYIWVQFSSPNYSFDITPSDTNVVIAAGSTAPTQYIPYSRTDTPIYIGDTPLASGEYVSYGEQKIYKYVDNVLTPTDPPVELPALPTIDGATIVDFDNTPKPSRMTGEVIGWETMTPKIYENGAWT